MGCDQIKIQLLTMLGISIHAARVGCDQTLLDIDTFKVLFQSTQPKRAATAFIRIRILGN